MKKINFLYIFHIVSIIHLMGVQGFAQTVTIEGQEPNGSTIPATLSTTTATLICPHTTYFIKITGGGGGPYNLYHSTSGSPNHQNIEFRNTSGVWTAFSSVTTPSLQGPASQAICTGGANSTSNNIMAIRFTLAGTYTLFVEDCAATSTNVVGLAIQVGVEHHPSGTLTYDKCQNDGAFNINPGLSGEFYTWDKYVNGVFIGTTSSASSLKTVSATELSTLTNPSVIVYTLIAADGTTSCLDSVDYTVNILDNPVLSPITIDNSEICVSGTATAQLDCSNCTSPTYTWEGNLNSGGFQTLDNFLINGVVTANGPTTPTGIATMVMDGSGSVLLPGLLDIAV
ncbi:hypothetical protein OAK19_05600, partial [Aureispira]|nr:hypothetical protein [Aureispira sp.]